MSTTLALTALLALTGFTAVAAGPTKKHLAPTPLAVGVSHVPPQHASIPPAAPPVHAVPVQPPPPPAPEPPPPPTWTPPPPPEPAPAPTWTPPPPPPHPVHVERAAPPAVTAPRSTVQHYARTHISDTEQYECLDKVVKRESGWDPQATNPDSGAYGIPQSLPAEKMASAGDDYRSNPITQMKWMLSYIKNRYGTPCNALQHEYDYGWY